MGVDGTTRVDTRVVDLELRTEGTTLLSLGVSGRGVGSVGRDWSSSSFRSGVVGTKRLHLRGTDKWEKTTEDLYGG